MVNASVLVIDDRHPLACVEVSKLKLGIQLGVAGEAKMNVLLTVQEAAAKWERNHKNSTSLLVVTQAPDTVGHLDLTYSPSRESTFMRGMRHRENV